MKRLKVLLADDQILFLHSLKRVLEISAPDLEIVGTATNGQEAVDLVERAAPDVVLLDVRMPVMDGVEATRIIHERFPQTSIVVLTTFDDDKYVQDALRYGAKGYLLKDIPPDELINSVRMVRDSPILMASRVVENLLNKAGELKGTGLEAGLAGGEVRPVSGATEPLSATVGRLSIREREILRLVLRELDNKAIASELFLAEQTVRNHVSEIYDKLGVHSRLELIRTYKDVQSSL